MTKDMIDGTVIMTAIIVPLNAISRIESLDSSLSDNRKNSKNGNKNQRLVRKYCPNFYLIFNSIQQIHPHQIVDFNLSDLLMGIVSYGIKLIVQHSL